MPCYYVSHRQIGEKIIHLAYWIKYLFAGSLWLKLHVYKLVR